jgi:hypothetical protein
MTTIAARDIESGLEVVPQAWASNPEVHDGNFPEVHHGEDGLEVVPIAYKTDKILYDPIAPATPWWRRKKMIIFGAVGLIVVAVALGAGLGVGLLKKANSSGPSSE